MGAFEKFWSNYDTATFFAVLFGFMAWALSLTHIISWKPKLVRTDATKDLDEKQVGYDSIEVNYGKAFGLSVCIGFAVWLAIFAFGKWMKKQKHLPSGYY